MSDRNIMWGAFILLVGVMVLLDLSLNRSSRQVTIREALYWSLLWVGLALAFNTGIYFTMGKQPALEFFAGYLIEKSLSVDNLFV
ncbi:MAG: TerC family protein, partial [Trichlorobacter sp.]